MYSSSTSLDEVSLTKYLESLCEIMKEKTDRQQIISVLQKISETVGMNINRNLKTWEAIWPVVHKNIIDMINSLSGGEHQDLADMGLDTLR